MFWRFQHAQCMWSLAAACSTLQLRSTRAYVSCTKQTKRHCFLKQETTTTGKQNAARTSRLRQHAGMHVIQALARCSNAQASILTGFTCQQAASSTQERKATHNTAHNKQKGQQTAHNHRTNAIGYALHTDPNKQIDLHMDPCPRVE